MPVVFISLNPIVVANPFGLTEVLKVALDEVMFVAGLAVTEGARAVIGRGVEA